MAAADSAIVTCLQAAIEALALAGRARAEVAQQAQHAQLTQHSAPGRAGACLAAVPGQAEQAQHMQHGVLPQGDARWQQKEGMPAKEGVTSVPPWQLGPLGQQPLHDKEQQQALRQAGQEQREQSQQPQQWLEAGQQEHVWQCWPKQEREQLAGPTLRPRRGTMPTAFAQEPAAAPAAAGKAGAALAMGAGGLGGNKQQQHPTHLQSTNKRKRTPRTGSSSAAAAAAACAAAATGGGDTPAPISPLPARAGSLTPARHAGKGLRQFSLKVCEVVELKGRTTYHEVADELVKHLQQQGRAEGGTDGNYDEKNIRRRVYDALNVLMAVGVIRKEKKEIVWGGWPQGLAANSNHALEAERSGVAARVEEKGLVHQLCRLGSLALRNHDTPMTKLQQQRGAGQLAPNPLQLPFMLIQAPGAADVDVSISEDSRVAQLNFHSWPFQIYDDESVLRMLGVGGAPQDLLRRFAAARSAPSHRTSVPSGLAGPGTGSRVGHGTFLPLRGCGGAGRGLHGVKGLTPAAAGKGHIGMYPRLTPSPAAAAAAAAGARVAPAPTAAGGAPRAPHGELVCPLPFHGGPQKWGSHSGGFMGWGQDAAAAGQSPQLLLQEGLDALVQGSLQWPQQWFWQQEPQQDSQRERGQPQERAPQTVQPGHGQQQHQPDLPQMPPQVQPQQQQWEEGSGSQEGVWRDADVHAFQSACTDGMLNPALDLGGWDGLLPFTH
ncbi:hypothetical protein N2152v2_005120 [Parachlorella kessleri]